MLSIGGLWLLAGKPDGFLIGAVASIQAALYQLVLTVNSCLSIIANLSTWPGELIIWTPLLVITSTIAIALLRRINVTT